MSLGLKQGVNQLVSYSANWPDLYAEEAEKILLVCSDSMIAIEHVGSTSIPNIKAKPIIDILAGVAHLEDAETMIPAMQSIGYDYPGNIGIPDDRIFGRDPGFRKFLVHVVTFEGSRWHRYLCFRDALRADRKLATDYETLKTSAVETFPLDRGKYTAMKSSFINRVVSITV